MLASASDGEKFEAWLTQVVLQVQKTMKAIKHALTERYYAWEDARILAEDDPEIEMSSETNPNVYAYTPREYLEEEVTDPEALEAEAGAGARQEELEKLGAETIDPSTLPKTPETPPTSARS
jgi:large subunit ribosomal protein L47